MASPLSLHCIICCEPFNNVDVYPVVLPCGHTYICSECGQRLERCMECRQSLFLPEDKPNNEPQRRQHEQDRYRSASAYSNRSVSSRQSRYYRSTPQVRSLGSLESSQKEEKLEKKEKRRYPLPKNVVLMSLMETITKSGETEQKAMRLLTSIQNRQSTSDDDYEEEINTNVVVSLASKVCGTYMVSYDEAISVFALKKEPKPSPQVKPVQKAKKKSKEDKFFRISKASKTSKTRNVLDEVDLNTDNQYRQNNLKNVHQTTPIDTLYHGDRVQVINIIDNWAILARKKGIVAIDKLIKVGGPVDEACRLEGILLALTEKKKTLVKQQKETANIFDALTKDMNASLCSEDFTIQRAPKKDPEDITKLSDDESLKSAPMEDKSSSSMAIELELKPKTALNAESIPSSPPHRNTEQRQKEQKYHTPNFRTGMSGHRGVGHYSSARNDRTPTLSRSNIMSSHRGLSGLAVSSFRSFYSGTERRNPNETPTKPKSTSM